nr:unnamed protein product [Callosobruchus chinensis]
MSEILNISQTSQNHDPLSNNSINARICRTKIEKERQKFIEELLFETDPEAVSDQIKEDTKNYVYDSRFQKDFDCEEKNQTNMKRINSDSQSKSPKIKTDAILKISKNHDVSQIVKEVLEENGSQESEPMQISSDLQEELSKAVNRAFELMKNNTDISERDYVERQHTSRAENNTNEEEREEGEEVLLRRNITDNMKRAMESSGLSIVVARLKDSEEEYLKSYVNHETPKRITDEETHHHSLTRSTKNKKVPMMGTAALLQKANIDHTDYLIIQDLILSKYSTKIREYLERNHKRRKSRCEHFEEYLLTDQYTPSSISSLDYISSSDGYDSKAFSSLERVHSGKSSSITSSPIIQNQTRSYSINDISKDSQTSCSSLSEPESSRSGCFGDSTKLRPQEVEGIFLQKPVMEEGKLGECMQYLECYGTATSYERKYSHGIESVTDNIDQISYETSGGQNSEKHSSYMKSSDDLDVHNLANNSICSTYSVSKFIANALDGVNQEHDNSNDTLESASYASPNYTSIDESITTSKISDLLSKESTLTNGRRLIRSDSLYGDLTPQEYHLELEFLTGELSIQNQILLQASKAVKHCRANNILHTTGYIEAERILLLTCKYGYISSQKH